MPGDLKPLDLNPQPVDAVVRELEDLLAQAKSGRLRGFVFAGHYDAHLTPNCTLVRRAGERNVGVLVAAIERVKLRLLGFVEDIDLGLEGKL